MAGITISVRSHCAGPVFGSCTRASKGISPNQTRFKNGNVAQLTARYAMNPRTTQSNHVDKDSGEAVRVA
jgi:hypothetical protein